MSDVAVLAEMMRVASTGFYLTFFTALSLSSSISDYIDYCSLHLVDTIHLVHIPLFHIENCNAIFSTMINYIH